jgi:carbon storage regulator
MLVLSRKPDEQIVIGVGDRTVVVRVMEIKAGRVRLGIAAPENVAVHRQEVWNRMSSWHRPTRKAPIRQEP